MTNLRGFVCEMMNVVSVTALDLAKQLPFK